MNPVQSQDAAAAEIPAVLGLRTPTRGRAAIRIAAMVVVGVVVIAGAIAAWRAVGQSPPPVFVSAPVTRGALQMTVTATGTLQPLKQVDVGAEISGRILAVLADFNQRVARGQVLATLDTEQLASRVKELAASLDATRASLAQATATAAEALQKAERSETLAAGGLLPAQDLDSARAALTRSEAGVASARAQVAVAQAGLDGARTTLGKAVIRSPISGIVIDRAVEPGQTVAASFQTPVLFTLAADLSQMLLHVDVDEADVGRVAERQPATFTVDAFAGRQFPAEIVSLRNAARTVQGVVSYEAVLAVANADGALRPGMTATATITTARRENALLVPNAALRFTPPETTDGADVTGSRTDATQQRVWVLDRGVPSPVSVTVGASDGLHTEVVAGELQPGTHVLVDLAEETR